MSSSEAKRQAAAAAAGKCRVHRDRPSSGDTGYCQECRESRRRIARERYLRDRGFREVSRPIKCSICGTAGHNKTTCPRAEKGA